MNVMKTMAVIPKAGPMRAAQIGWRGATPVVECEDREFIGAWVDGVVAGFATPVEEEAVERRKFIAGFEPGTRCAYCLMPTERVERDHIIPFSAGGTESYDNIVPACRFCNGSKGDKTLLQFVAAGGIS